MKSRTIDLQPATRIADIKPYYFTTLAERIQELKARNVDVIRLDMGAPDLPPPAFITEALVESVRKSNTHSYTSSGGTPAYRQAIATYYQQRFNVSLDPQTETLGLIGSKEGLFNLNQALLNPGDVALVPDPAYPVYKASSRIAGAEVFPLPLLGANHFLPDLGAIPAKIARKAKVLWLNYPNNPTGAIASLDFFSRALDFAEKHNIVLCHDNPYADVCFEDYHAPSLMQVNGAKEIAVEFNSLAKAFNMAGWRLGMVVGNPDVIRVLNTYKSQVDNAHFEPVLAGGITALTGEQTWLLERNQVYCQRRDIIVSTLCELGFHIDTPQATIYIWAQLPQNSGSSVDFCDRLLRQTGVSTAPGVVYGEHGGGYLRISLGTPTPRIQEAMDRLRNWITHPA